MNLVMEGLIRGKPISPGIRFHPTDVELFMYYLKRKVLGKSLEPQMIAEVNVYQFPPWELPALSCVKTKDLKWYFFCPRKKIYPNGKRPNRAAKYGYWKATGKDRSVSYRSRVVGKIKTLVFYRGKAPDGERTNWVIHEYVLEDCVVADKGVPKDAYVICEVYEKSGSGPKNGEDYGAPFVEEEWESDDDSDHVEGGADGLALHELSQGCVGRSPDGSGSALTSAAVASPDSVAAATNAGSPNSTFAAAVANAGFPNSIFAAAVANAGSPNSTFAAATGAGLLDHTFAAVANSGSLDSTLAAAGTPCTTATTAGAASLDAPTATATIVTAASVGTPANVAAAAASASADLANDEINIMLSNFTEDHLEDFGNIFDDLEDLHNFSTHTQSGSSNLFIGLDEM